MNTCLRTAVATDASRVASLLIDTRAAFMPYAPSAHPDTEVRAWVANRLIPSGGVTVAELDGRVVGLISTEPAGDMVTVAIEASAEPADGTSWITQMAVDPSLVGQGIGSRLLAHALDSLARPIRLYTFQANAGARRFYERHGFVAIEFTDGRDNEERCPDVLYELAGGELAVRRPERYAGSTR